MNISDQILHKEILNRAESITLKLENADKDIVKIAAVLSAMLDRKISLPHFTSEIVENRPSDEEYPCRKPVVIRPHPTHNLKIVGGSLEILFREYPGGIRGPLTLDKLITSILASDICKPTMPGHNKSEIIRPLAFYLGCLSALAGRADLPENLRPVCLAGREEALKLSAAAIYCPDEKTLEDMAVGIAVVSAAIRPQKTDFAKRLDAVIEAYKNLVAEYGVEPLKGHVIDDAIKILKKKNIEHPDRGDSSRWRELINKAGLKHLKQVRGTRGKSKNL
ncbi:MAG: hypothetical protein RLZZ505_2764 [Verrucomicrobiota bacterium]|jgi:hypothetical protein